MSFFYSRSNCRSFKLTEMRSAASSMMAKSCTRMAGRYSALRRFRSTATRTSINLRSSGSMVSMLFPYLANNRSRKFLQKIKIILHYYFKLYLIKYRMSNSRSFVVIVVEFAPPHNSTNSPYAWMWSPFVGDMFIIAPQLSRSATLAAGLKILFHFTEECARLME